MTEIPEAEFLKAPHRWLEATCSGDQVAVKMENGSTIVLGNGPMPEATAEDLVEHQRRVQEILGPREPEGTGALKSSCFPFTFKSRLPRREKIRYRSDGVWFD